MSDTSQGPGWWLASDGKWYAPQGAVPESPPLPPTPEMPTPVSPAPPTYAPPTSPGAPPVPPGPGMPPPYTVPGGAAAPKQGMHGCLKALIIGGGIAVVLGILAFVALGIAAKNVADDVNASIDRGALEDLTDTTGDFDSSDIGGSDGEFCANVLDLDKFINGDIGETRSEVEEHFDGYDDLIRESDRLIPTEIDDEGEVFVGFHRDILGLVEDADFDPDDLDVSAVEDLSTPEVADAARAVNAHCGFVNPPSLDE